MFRLRHKDGILKEWFPFNVLQKIDGVSMNFTEEDIPMDKKISVREAIKFVSIAGGQGYKKSLCKLISVFFIVILNSIQIRTKLYWIWDGTGTGLKMEHREPRQK